MSPAELIAIGAPVISIAGFALWFRGRRSREERRAIQEFRTQRERLEAKFFDLAAASGKPRGLRWVNCDWGRDVTFARDARTSLLTAFVAVEIQFEAVEGGDMEDVDAVGTIRDASAVFHYQAGQWGTGGKALFNMNPQEALKRLTDQFEPIESQPAGGDNLS
ncbi:MAG: hypothetical protein DWQ34_27910 [Planctomycetota bacterium]|nr:MAG: hypothetical protein DWQ34_27910 [Planctomycetota bacterium]REK21388.1 MAG: hypothetical protein DWQ41_21380 [Planctomycetota bacterium]REK40101.1 MAG: hypothetical protein DWQ45_00665 [Planctomycetota bacterium]